MQLFVEMFVYFVLFFVGWFLILLGMCLVLAQRNLGRGRGLERVGTAFGRAWGWVSRHPEMQLKVCLLCQIWFLCFSYKFLFVGKLVSVCWQTNSKCERT
jgi:hypothetical protein